MNKWATFQEMLLPSSGNLNAAVCVMSYGPAYKALPSLHFFVIIAAQLTPTYPTNPEDVQTIPISQRKEKPHCL